MAQGAYGPGLAEGRVWRPELAPLGGQVGALLVQRTCLCPKPLLGGGRAFPMAELQGQPLLSVSGPRNGAPLPSLPLQWEKEGRGNPLPHREAAAHRAHPSLPGDPSPEVSLPEQDTQAPSHCDTRPGPCHRGSRMRRSMLTTSGSFLGLALLAPPSLEVTLHCPRGPASERPHFCF